MAKGYDVFIGSYGTENEETIHWLKFNPDIEDFVKISTLSGVDNPSFIMVNHAKTHLYAVSEVEEGQVVSYEIDYDDKKLRELNRQPTKGGPCFLEIDKYDRYLFTANYGGGSFIVHPLHKDGHIESFTDFHQYDSSKRTSHVHAIKNIPGTSMYVVTDLGHDKLNVYEHQAGKLKFITALKTVTGSGPRHMAFQSKLNVMYILNQDDSKTLVYTYSEKNMKFKLIQIVPTLIEPFDGTNYGADIHISGAYLYVSNRGHHSITTYKILADGRLEMIANTASGGKWPRNFAVVPNDKHVIIANEHTNNLNVMNISQDGRLKDTGKEWAVNKPVCVSFM